MEALIWRPSVNLSTRRYEIESSFRHSWSGLCLSCGFRFRNPPSNRPGTIHRRLLPDTACRGLESNPGSGSIGEMDGRDLVESWCRRHDAGAGKLRTPGRVLLSSHRIFALDMGHRCRDGDG